MSAHTACSRELPQPKLGPATRICAPAACGRSSGETPGVVAAPVGEEAARQALAHGALQESRGDDLVGVDVVRRQHDVRERTTATGWRRAHATSSRGSAMRPAHRGRGGGERAGEERAPAGALPSLEVAVAGADRVLAALQPVAVHRDAHRAAGLAPLGARLAEHAVEPLRLRLALHLLRARAPPARGSRARPCARASRTPPAAGRRAASSCSCR